MTEYKVIDQSNDLGLGFRSTKYTTILQAIPKKHHTEIRLGWKKMRATR